MSNSSNIMPVTDDTFTEIVLNSKIPVLVDFWAEWCGPCNMIAPMLLEIAKEYEDKILIVKIDVDKNRETPAKYGVRGIPTLSIFKNGAVCATQSGAGSKDQLAEFIDENI